MGKKRKKERKQAITQKTKKIPKMPKAEKAAIWHYFVPPVILSLFTILFYAPSMKYAFQFDDIANIMKHFNIRHDTLKTLFFSGTRWVISWLNTIHYSISQFDPFSYRIGNLIIHISNGVLVFFILFIGLRHLKKKSFFRDNALSLSFLTALLFLLHPIQTQTVSYVIQGQLEGLAAFSIFSMSLCFLQLCYEQSIFKKYIFAFLLFSIAALSCGTKEIAIISPAMILLIDWFFVAQGDFKSLMKRMYIHIPLAIVVVTIFLYFLKPTFFTEILGLQRVAKNNIGNIITSHVGEKITPWMFFRSQFKVILHYIWMFLWPFNISVEYDWVLARHFFAFDCIIPLIILLSIGLSILKLLLKNRASMIGFGALWFFVAIAPRSSIIPSPELLVDYKTYTASLGWLFLIAAAIIYLYQLKVTSWLETFNIKTAALFHPNFIYCKVLLAILLAIPLGFLTIQRNNVWSSGLHFWGDMVKKSPGKARVHNNYGVELSQRHDFRASIPYFKKAISMDAQYADPWNNLAVAHANLREIDNAINSLKQSLKIYPYYPEGYNNLASFYMQKKEYAEAERLLKIAIRLRPHYGKAYMNLGRMQFAKGEKEAAWESFKKCCTECDLDNVPYGFATYGKMSMQLKKYDEAIFAYQKTLSLDPENTDAAFNLANAFYMTKKYDNAIEIYKQLTKKNSRDAKSWYNLGETYLIKEQFLNALCSFQKVKQLNAPFPLLYIRIANCFEKIGKPHQSKRLLHEFIDMDNKNNTQIIELQEKAKVLLCQLNKKYVR